MDSFNIGELSNAQLVDHLQNAVMEEDVTYTVFWLRALGKRKQVDVAVTPHSWRMSSALSTICVRPYTLTRHCILQVLLVRTTQQTFQTEAGKLAANCPAEWAKHVIAAWYCGGKEQAPEATKLLQMRSKDAEAWIRENLPPHTNPESLSGCSPLPPPPGKVAVPHPDAVNREASNAVSTLSIPLLQGDAHQPTFSQIASVTSEFFPSTMPLPSPSRSSRTPDDRSTDCTTSRPSADEIPLPCPIRLYINGFSQDIPFDILRNFSVSLGVRLFDTCLVRGNNRNALICTVRSKACFDSLIKIVEKPQDPTVRVRLALPRNPQLPHHHVLVRGLTQNTSIESLANWATRSRCAPFETQVGYLGEERVGIFRVETAWGANEAARLLAEPSINHPPLKTFWGKGPGPSNLSAVPFPPPFTLPRQPTPTAIAKHSYHRSATLVTFVHPSRRLPSVTPSLSPGPDLRSKSPFSIFSDPTNSSSSRQTSIPHSLPSHCPPDEEQEETPISSSHSQHQNESSKSPTSPPAPITNLIDLTSSSPEPVPFALPDSSFVPPPIAQMPSSLSRSSPNRLSPHLDLPSHSLEPKTTSQSTTRQIEFAALVEKRLSSRDLNL